MCLRVKTKYMKYQPDSSKNESGFLLLKNMRGAKTVLIWFGNKSKRMKKCKESKQNLYCCLNDSGCRVMLTRCLTNEII
jgi:hypothetical protein